MDATLSMASSTSTKRQHHDDPAHKRGLRTVAAIEFSKGVLGVCVIFGVLWLLRQDLWDVSFALLEFFHINPDRRWAQALLDLADRTTDAQLWTIAAVLFAYCTIRFIEAYGLWMTRVWAEWLAILSGLIYLPFEIRELLHKTTLLRWGLLLGNIVLVGYVAYVRISGRRAEKRAQLQASSLRDTSAEKAYSPEPD